jgi:hypothetical protein
MRLDTLIIALGWSALFWFVIIYGAIQTLSN